MDALLSHLLSLKQGAQRAGNAIACESCGTPLTPKRGSRRQRFCSDACKQTAFRSKKWASRQETPEALRSVENPPAISAAYRDENGGPWSPDKVRFASGLGVSPQVRLESVSATSERARLIRNALRVEFSARWPTYSKKIATPTVLKQVPRWA